MSDCRMAHFVSLLQPEQRQVWQRRPDLLRELRQRVDVARMSHSAISLSESAFAAYLAERCPDVGRLEEALGRWSVDDLYLCCGCIAQDTSALAAFQRDYVPQMERVLQRLRLRAALVADARQELLSSLLVRREGKPPTIVRYSGRGRLSKWLRIVTARTGRALLEREKRLQPVSDEWLAEKILAQADSVELGQAKRRFRSAFKEAFKGALAGLDPSHLLLVRQRYLDGLEVKQIAAVQRVHPSTMSRRLEAIRRDLLVRTHELLARRLGVTRAECESIVRAIRSNIDITLRTFLGDRGSA